MKDSFFFLLLLSKLLPPERRGKGNSKRWESGISGIGKDVCQGIFVSLLSGYQLSSVPSRYIYGYTKSGKGKQIHIDIHISRDRFIRLDLYMQREVKRNEQREIGRENLSFNFYNFYLLLSQPLISILFHILQYLKPWLHQGAIATFGFLTGAQTHRDITGIQTYRYIHTQDFSSIDTFL